MPVKTEERISCLIIWSIYQPFWGPQLCVTQTYWWIEGYCQLHIEFYCYCLAQNTCSFVLRLYCYFTVIFEHTIQNISSCVGINSQYRCKLVKLSFLGQEDKTPWKQALYRSASLYQNNSIISLKYVIAQHFLIIKYCRTAIFDDSELVVKGYRHPGSFHRYTDMMVALHSMFRNTFQLCYRKKLQVLKLY